MSLQSLKKNVAIQPLAVIMTAAVTMVMAFSVRTLFLHPDVAWKKEQTPQNQYKNRGYIAYNRRNIDYATVSQVPDYKD